MEGFGVGTLFRQMAYAGDRDGALAILDEKRALLPRSGQPNTAGSWLMLALVIEGLVMLGEHSQAGQLYPLVCELIGTGRGGAFADLPLHAYDCGCRRGSGTSVGSG